MKKLFTIACALVITFSLAACGCQAKETTPVTTAPITIPTTVPMTTETTPETTMPMDPTIETNIPDPSVDTSIPTEEEETIDVTEETMDSNVQNRMRAK